MVHRMLMVGFAASLLAGCGGSVKETLGLERQPPDEFRVLSRPPLSVPPEFSLRPPDATDEGPAAQAADVQARALVTGEEGADGNRFILQSGSGNAAKPVSIKPSARPLTPEKQFLKNAGIDGADPRIRETLREEKVLKQQQEEETPWWNMMSVLPDKKEPMVDAKGEAERIERNEKAGKPITEGDTPGTDARDTGILGRILGY